MASTDEAPQVTGVAEIPAKPDAADDEDLKGTAFWAREIYANLLAALTTSFAAISLGAVSTWYYRSSSSFCKAWRASRCASSLSPAAGCGV